LTKLANAVLTGKLEARQREIAADAVDNLEKLGPTFIKLGQIMSIRLVTLSERSYGNLRSSWLAG
jgi:predicted unusual protein kinase regulating ubiquinone biosynthesis (AarF/ABC1/UbiB family)